MYADQTSPDIAPFLKKTRIQYRQHNPLDDREFEQATGPLSILGRPLF